MTHTSTKFEAMLRAELERLRVICETTDDAKLSHFADECRDRLAGVVSNEFSNFTNYHFVNHLRRLNGEGAIP